MKKIFAFLVFAALAFAGCKENNPEPLPPVDEPQLTLTSGAEMEFTAEGGDGEISYTLTNAKEGVSVVATCEAEWVTDVTVAETVTFTVVANEGDARQTKVVVEYDTKSFEVAVKQAAKGGAPEVEATIALAVSNIAWNDALVSVAPSTAMEYILGVMTKADFAAYSENVEGVVDHCKQLWQESADLYAEMGYTDPWQYYMQIEQRSGEDSYSIKDDAISNLTWNTDYVVYCFGMNDDGEQLTKVATAEFHTVAPVASNNTFTITIDTLTKSSVEFTVATTNDDPYYVTIEQVSVLEPYAPDYGEELVRNILPTYNTQIAQRTFSGTKSLTNSDLGKSVNSFKEYQVVVWGFENGPTTAVYVSEPFKPADPVVEFVPTITIDEVTHNAVTYSIVSNAHGTTYYHNIFPAATVGEDVNAFAEALVAEGLDTAQLSASTMQYTATVEPECDYRVVAFGYDADNNVVSSEVFVSDVITTPAKPQGEATIDIEVTNLAWNGADIYLTPSLPFQYYYNVYTKAEFNEMFTTPNDFIDATIEMWKDEAAMYSEEWTQTMSYYTRTGYGVADIGTLKWSTDYVFVIFGIDDDGTLLTDALTAEFCTLTPTPSSNSFTITIDAMTKTSVEFTVTTTNDDPYYVTVEQVGVIDKYAPDYGDAMIDELLPDYANQIAQRTFSGTQTITNSQLNKTVNSFKEYRVVVWGFNNGPTTAVYMSEAFKPADPE